MRRAIQIDVLTFFFVRLLHQCSTPDLPKMGDAGPLELGATIRYIPNSITYELRDSNLYIKSRYSQPFSYIQHQATNHSALPALFWYRKTLLHFPGIYLQTFNPHKFRFYYLLVQAHFALHHRLSTGTPS